MCVLYYSPNTLSKLGHIFWRTRTYSVHALYMHCACTVLHGACIAHAQIYMHCACNVHAHIYIHRACTELQCTVHALCKHCVFNVQFTCTDIRVATLTKKSTTQLTRLSEAYQHLSKLTHSQGFLTGIARSLIVNIPVEMCQFARIPMTGLNVSSH